MPDRLRDTAEFEKSLSTLKVGAVEKRMIAEIEAKINDLAKQNPGMAAAWGAGCGGVNC
jgi:hypothetical protein